MLLRVANLSLLILYPVAWAAPLLRAGVLPLFGLTEISVLSGLKSLWDTDLFLGLTLVQFRLIGPRALPVLQAIGKLAMADVFLIALYVTLSKGIGIGRIETAWGLYLFTGCILASLFIGHRAQKIA